MRNAGLSGVCLALVATVSGCASIVSGTNQPLTVETRYQGAPVSGATCKLVNDKGIWYVTTPGSVIVHRSLAELKLTCEKAGAVPGLANIKSSTKAMAFGNAVFGGLIGVGIDVASGAAFDYPDLIQVEMGAGTGALAATTTIALAGPGGSPMPEPTAITRVEPPASSNGGAAQASPQAPAVYPRALSGPDIAAHFQRHNRLEIKQARAFTIKINPDGRVERDCPSCNVSLGQGTMNIKTSEGLACFRWYNVSYPESGCYRVLQTGQNEYSIDDALAQLHYRYAVPAR
jgi:hypothetical protein